jgi:hypothetical protein
MKAVLGRSPFNWKWKGSTCPVGHRAGTKEGVSLDEHDSTKESQVFLISS